MADQFLGATAFHSITAGRVSGSGFEKLQDALSATATGEDESDAIRAMQLLEGFDTLNAHTVQAAQSLITQKNPDIALTAVALLLNTRTIGSLRTLEAFIHDYRSDYHSWAFINIGSSLGQFRDPDAVPILATLSRSKSLSVRDGAVRALRGIRTSRAVPVLVERLDDNDPTIRYLAVITLAEVLGKYDGDYGPSKFLFDKRPQYYVSLWKQWWADEGSKLYPGDSKVD